MIATVRTATVYGIDGIGIDVEVDISHGLPSFAIVGLPETSVKESKDRVRAAIKNGGFEFPSDRIVVNLAPADVRKEGSAFDLPIALGIISAMGFIKEEALDECFVAGELSLDGSVKAVRGVLPMALKAKGAGVGTIIVPMENAREAAIVEGLTVYAATHLLEIVHFLRGEGSLPEARAAAGRDGGDKGEDGLDFADIKGHSQAKRAIEIAAGGGHNLLMIGPPGSGKTMLARRIPTIIPALNYEEAIETTKIHSIAGTLGGERGLITERPFRAPHHTISDAGLIGGGHMPKPGEVSLAHNGVLFLDEFPEFRRNALDALRQPLEDGAVTVSRVTQAITFPARFMLVAAMNPCPCGFWADPRRSCSCTGAQIRRYRSRVSGPLLDRIDIHIEVPAVTIRELTLDGLEEPSESIGLRVGAARKIQEERFAGRKIYCNGQMPVRLIKRHCLPSASGQTLLERAVERFGLSPRAYHRILKVARTIADMEQSETIADMHIAEAIQYRALDRRVTA